ncbi:MAG: hypothetical protein R2712_23110 [Vicinamibacterales bacterium]
MGMRARAIVMAVALCVSGLAQGPGLAPPVSLDPAAPAVGRTGTQWVPLAVRAADVLEGVVAAARSSTTHARTPGFGSRAAGAAPRAWAVVATPAEPPRFLASVASPAIPGRAPPSLLS